MINFAAIAANITILDAISFVSIFIVFLYSVVLHEIAHGYAAYKSGDDTAYLLGRITLNPIKHIDLFMTIIVPIGLFFLTRGAIIFGGAKPVPVNPYRYRHPVRDDIFVSSAGVMVNFLLAFFFALILHVLFRFSTETVQGSKQIIDGYYLPLHVAAYGLLINLILGIFNLIPIPPLDGSHIFKYLLPPQFRMQYQKIGFFGIIILLFLMQTHVFSTLFNYAIAYFAKITMLDPFLFNQALG